MNLGKSIYVSHESQVKHHVALTRGQNSLHNEKNSRYLFQKWRSKIKNELSKVWKPLLSTDVAHVQALDGDLAPEFLSTPYAAARTISENILSREEHRWSRELDGRDLNANIYQQIFVRGARYKNELLGYLVDNEIKVILKNTISIQNFYVCGRKISDAVFVPLEIIISVNDIHQKIFILGAERHINVGIINPILNPCADTVFSVTIRGRAENGLLIDAGNSVLITHFVIDEKIINQF